MKDAENRQFSRPMPAFRRIPFPDMQPLVFPLRTDVRLIEFDDAREDRKALARHGEAKDVRESLRPTRADAGGRCDAYGRTEKKEGADRLSQLGFGDPDPGDPNEPRHPFGAALEAFPAPSTDVPKSRI